MVTTRLFPASWWFPRLLRHDLNLSSQLFSQYSRPTRSNLWKQASLLPCSCLFLVRVYFRFFFLSNHHHHHHHLLLPSSFLHLSSSSSLLPLHRDRIRLLSLTSSRLESLEPRSEGLPLARLPPPKALPSLSLAFEGRRLLLDREEEDIPFESSIYSMIPVRSYPSHLSSSPL